MRSFISENANVRIGVGRAGNVIGGGDWADDRIVPDCVRAWAAGDIASLRNPSATRPWQHVLEPLSGYMSLAIALKEKASLHGEAFNFGPSTNHNLSVADLVDSMAIHWDQVRWEDISNQNDGPYESGLLKLNCDKALHLLQWQATWNFDATVRETVLWYREYYVRPSSSIIDFSTRQIATYVQAAKKQGIKWAL